VTKREALARARRQFGRSARVEDRPASDRPIHQRRPFRIISGDNLLASGETWEDAFTKAEAAVAKKPHLIR